MVSGTHVIIANIVYKHLLKKCNIKIDFPAFVYGAIKPDFHKSYINRAHTLEASIKSVCAYAKKLMKSKCSLKEFSMGLGVVCHFVSDYFCLPHQRQYWKKDSLRHGAYEAALQLKMLSIYNSGNIKINYRFSFEKTLMETIIKLHKEYEEKEQGISNDIAYSIIASICACEFVALSGGIEKLIGNC